MSVNSIITYGFGSYGSVNSIFVYGFSLSEVLYVSPLFDLEFSLDITRSYNTNLALYREYSTVLNCSRSHNLIINK